MTVLTLPSVIPMSFFVIRIVVNDCICALATSLLTLLPSGGQGPPWRDVSEIRTR